MVKAWKILLIISIGLTILAFLYKKVEDYGRTLEKTKQQEEEIIEQKKDIKKAHEVIETKKNQQKIINKTSDSIDVDARIIWMYLILRERAANQDS